MEASSSPFESTLSTAGIESPDDQRDFDSWAQRRPVVFANALKAALRRDTSPLRELADQYVLATTPDEAWLASKAVSSYLGSDGRRMALVKGQHIGVSNRSLRVPVSECLQWSRLREQVPMPSDDGTPVFELKL